MDAQLTRSLRSADADVRAARLSVSQQEQQYAHWTSEYVARAQQLRSFEENALSGRAAADASQRRAFLRHELQVATKALEIGVAGMKGAYQELEHARAFFLRLLEAGKASEHLATTTAPAAADEEVQQQQQQQDEPVDWSVESSAESPANDTAVSPGATRTEARYHLERRYRWNHRNQFVPEDFQFPKSNVDLMWLLWCRGDSEKHYPPFRFLRGIDLPTANARKRMSDLRLLMVEVESRVRAKKCWVERPTAQQAASMLDAVKGEIGLVTVSSKDKRRRSAEDLSWLSAVDAVRRAKKKRKDDARQTANPPSAASSK